MRIGMFRWDIARLWARVLAQFVLAALPGLSWLVGVVPGCGLASCSPSFGANIRRRPPFSTVGREGSLCKTSLLLLREAPHGLLDVDEVK